MPDQQPVTETKSAERLVFEHYLRTGQRLSTQAWVQEVEHKFNPYHDPRNGCFTFAPGGPRSLSHVIVSDRRGLHRTPQQDWGSMAAGYARTDPSGTNRLDKRSGLPALPKLPRPSNLHSTAPIPERAWAATAVRR